MEAVMVRHFRAQRRRAAGEMCGSGMPRRWHMYRMNSASERRAPRGMRRQRRREAAPRTALARTRATAWGAAREARRSSDRRREMACEKTVWECRLARRRMLAMEGVLVRGSNRSEWTVVKRSVS